MMFEYLGENDIGHNIERALEAVLTEGKVLTYHMGGDVSTTGFAEAIAEKLVANG
jgi:isocitrate/isopropylmalate dehydrogenase